MDALFCYHILLMVLATLAFIFLWTGFSTPGWLVVTFQERQAESEYTVSSINRSLFYDIHCPQELRDCKTCQAGDASDECVTDMAYVAYTYHYTWIEALTADKEEWVAWRVIMIVAVVLATFGFILVLCLVCCIFRTYTYRLVASTGFFLWLIAGIIVWVPVGMVADMQSNVQDTVDSDVPHDATMHIPYSVVLVGIAGFLALVVALMLLWLTGVCGGQDREKSETRSDTELFSDRTVVRDRRYYGPHPMYQPERPVYYREPEPIPAYVQEQVVVDDYPYYKGSSAWGPNPWYDNRYGHPDDRSVL